MSCFFNVHPLLLVLWVGATERVCLLYTPHQIFIYMDEIIPETSLLMAQYSQLLAFLSVVARQMLHSLNNHVLDLLQYVHVSLVLGNPALYTALQMYFTRTEQRGRITSLDLLTMFCQPSQEAAGICHMSTLLASGQLGLTRIGVSWGSTRTPKSYSANLFSSW